MENEILFRWVKDEYDKLYTAVEKGRRVIAYVDYKWQFDKESETVCRDITTIRKQTWCFQSRGMGYSSYFEKPVDKDDFIKECQSLNIEWLEEYIPEVQEEKGKQWVIEIMERRYKDFAQNTGYLHSTKEVRKGIEIINEYFPDDYFENPSSPIESKTNDAWLEFMESEKTALGMSDHKTIDHLIWYYKTYFKNNSSERTYKTQQHKMENETQPKGTELLGIMISDKEIIKARDEYMANWRVDNSTYPERDYLSGVTDGLFLMLKILKRKEPIT